MVEEDYVSFETAKLLKEKGFDEDIARVVNEEGEIDYLGSFQPSLAYLYHSWYKCPTLQMAMKWLRDEKHYYIQVMMDGWACGGHSGYYVVIQKTDSDFEMMLQDAVDEVFYQTYEEACEAAIKYCLENLIKNEEEEEESDIPIPKTVNEAISTLEKILSNEDREYLLKNGAISMHNSLGRWIRNEWGLWTGSELKDELMNINKGLNHPDDMSNYIIEEFIEYWNNKL